MFVDRVRPLDKEFEKDLTKELIDEAIPRGGAGRPSWLFPGLARVMLTWLGERKQDAELGTSATKIERAVERVLTAGKTLTRDLGGQATSAEITKAVCEAL